MRALENSKKSHGTKIFGFSNSTKYIKTFLLYANFHICLLENNHLKFLQIQNVTMCIVEKSSQLGFWGSLWLMISVEILDLEVSYVTEPALVRRNSKYVKSPSLSFAHLLQLHCKHGRWDTGAKEEFSPLKDRIFPALSLKIGSRPS